MNKKRWCGSTVLPALVGILWLGCANPVDEEPLRWNQKIEFPVSNELFNVGEKLDDFFNFDSMEVLGVTENYSTDPTRLHEDSVDGDTVTFSIPRSRSEAFVTRQDTVGAKLFQGKLGAIPITGAPSLLDTLVKPAGAGIFDILIPVTVENVYHITFSDTTNSLSIRLTNISSEPFTDLTIGIVGVDSALVGDVEPGATKTAVMEVGGTSLSNNAQILFQGNASAVDEQMLGVEFSLNGLFADSVAVDDHLVSFHKEYTNRYELVDTVKIDYIDVEYGFFYYSLSNHTGMSFQVNEHHLHMWSIPAMGDSIVHLDDLSRLADSTSYSGYVTKGDGIIMRPHTEQDFVQKNVSQNRLFTQWDSEKGKSYTTVIYGIKTPPPTGDTLRLSARDSLTFSIHTTAFTFKEFVGTVMTPFFRDGDTQKVAVDLPFGEDATDSLRGKMVLQRVFGDLHLLPNMPKGAYLDTMRIQFAAFPSDSVNVVDSTVVTLIDIRDSMPYVASMDFTDVINCFPDTVCIVTKIAIPSGTKMKVVNDLKVGEPDYGRYMGRMMVNTSTTYRLNAALDWEIREDLNHLDLGGGRFRVVEPLQYIRKMQRRSALFNMNMTNSSNINMYLYALVAPHHLIDSLDSLSDGEVAAIIGQPGRAEELGFVNFLGTDGVYFPPRNPDTTTFHSVELNDRQLGIILDSDTCSWRWQMSMPRQQRDALTDTDFIKINSWLQVNGESNTDSLLIW